MTCICFLSKLSIIVLHIDFNSIIVVSRMTILLPLLGKITGILFVGKPLLNKFGYDITFIIIQKKRHMVCICRFYSLMFVHQYPMKSVMLANCPSCSAPQKEQSLYLKHSFIGLTKFSIIFAMTPSLSSYRIV